MNYIRLINSFYDRLETNSLSTSAIALWHALVHVNNKAGWQREFTVAVSVLCVKTGLSERTISNARNDLKIKGFLEFKSRKGSKSAVYQLADLSAMIAYKITDDEVLSATIACNASDNLSDNASDNLSDNASALIKEKETKENETKKVVEEAPGEDPYEFFEQNGFGSPGKYITNQINSWCTALSVELVLNAMKIAVENGKPKWNYVNSILLDWSSKKIENVDQATAAIQAYKVQHSKQRKQPRHGSTPVRKENLPDWFVKQQQQDIPDSNESEDGAGFEERKKAFEEKRKALEEELKKYKR